MTRWRKLAGLAAPLGVIALGCAWLIGLLSSIPEEVYFSGDGGLKALMVRQLLAGDWAPWLALDEPRWVRALWDQGMYPFRPPFVHALEGRWYSSFEWAFPTLSAPAYALAGDRGLYALPVLGLLAVWARFVVLLRTLRVGAVPSTVALALLVFATPLTFYAATFWEHTPAVALAFAGYADLLLLERDARRSRALRAGLLLGLACWLRPEAMVFGACALAAQLPSSQRRAVAMAGASFAAVLGVYFVFNRATYGEWLGVHAIQVLERPQDSATRLTEAIGLAGGLRDIWLEHMPLTWAALALVGTTLASRSPLGAIARRTVVVMLLAFLGTVIVVPNNGGMQIGPRYLLLLVPLTALLVALGVHQLAHAPRLARWSALLVLIGLGGLSAHENLGARSSRLADKYATRILPSVSAIERHPEAGVMFGHHWAALEMTHGIDGHPVVTVSSLAQIDRAVQAMVQHGHEVLLVDGPDGRRVRVGGRQRHGEVWIDWTVISERGQYHVLHGARSARP